MAEKIVVFSKVPEKVFAALRALVKDKANTMAAGGEVAIGFDAIAAEETAPDPSSYTVKFSASTPEHEPADTSGKSEEIVLLERSTDPSEPKESEDLKKV